MCRDLQASRISAVYTVCHYAEDRKIIETMILEAALRSTAAVLKQTGRQSGELTVLLRRACRSQGLRDKTR